MVRNTWSVSSCALLLLGLGAAQALDVKRVDDRNRQTRVIVVVDAAQPLEMASKKSIRQVLDARGRVILEFERVEKALQPHKFPNACDRVVAVISVSTGNSFVYLFGRNPGTACLGLVGEEGNKETYEIVVRREFLVALERVRRVQLASKKAIKKIENEGEQIVRAEIDAKEPSTAILRGLVRGNTRLRLIGGFGEGETIEIVVRSEQVPEKNLVILPMGTSQKMQMTGKNLVVAVNNSNAIVLVVSPVIGDPSAIEIKATGSGITRLNMKDLDGKQEYYEVIVPEPIK